MDQVTLQNRPHFARLTRELKQSGWFEAPQEILEGELFFRTFQGGHVAPCLRFESEKGQRLLLLGLVATAAGCLLGWALQAGFFALFAEQLPVQPAASGPRPYLMGAITALACLLCFAWPPLLRLGRASPLRVLRRDLPAENRRTVGDYALGFAALALLMWWYSRDLTLAAAVLATRFKGRANPASYNAPPHLDRTILRVRPWDAFCLLELSPTKMGKLVFDHVEAATLCVGVKDISTCSHHQFTFVGLTNINMDSTTHDHSVEHLFK